MDDRDRAAAARRTRHLNLARLLFSALALGLILAGLYTMRERSRSRGWVKTGGTVVSSTVSEFAGKSGRTYRPMVMYAYSVGAARFMSNRITFGQVASSRRASAERFVSRYPAGRRVDVYYDPQDPERAVLEPAGNPWIWIVAGGIFAMLTVWVRIVRGRLDTTTR
ncbi:MAG: DUF3592 domain-containing protein [Bacteroidales bacterium]